MSTSFWQPLLAVHEALTQRNYGHALLGGLAVSARAEPRFTRDIDLAVAVERDADAERLVQSLGALGYRPTFIVEQEAVGRMASVRLEVDVEGGRGVVIDLLFASSGIEPEIVTSAESLELAPGVVVPVARAGHLLVLKLLARDDVSRPQDAMDIRSLSMVLTPEDVALARSAVELITARGFDRHRDLRRLLDEVMVSPA